MRNSPQVWKEGAGLHKLLLLLSFLDPDRDIGYQATLSIKLKLIKLNIINYINVYKKNNEKN